MDEIHFRVGRENIVGRILGIDHHKKPDTVFFHGAGKSTKERAKQFFDESLFEVIPNIVTFDFSGHGESSGMLKKSSLKQRVSEARTAIELYTTKEKLTICGSSMGGYVALKMLASYDIKNLILFAPAIYDEKAFEVPFDQGFTEILQGPESWKNSDVLADLEKFTGNLLLFIGSDDEVIPDGMVNLIAVHSSNAARKEIVRFGNCPHALHCWLDDHPLEKKQVAEKISEHYLIP